MSRTLIVSDLHLGDRAQGDVLRHEGIAEVLAAALEGVDRLVLLGDTLELRNQPARVVLDAAAPVLARLAEQLGTRPVLIAAGNHDHALIERWLAHNREPLGLDQRFAPQEASDLGGALAAALEPGAVEFAYPGLWLREDVYATHGHYLDVHMTVPTFERIAIAASGRLALERTRRWNDVHSPDDYEALLTPVYAWMHSAAQSGRAGPMTGGGGTLRAWRALRGRSPGARALAAGFPLAVAALNGAGLGPVRSEVSSQALCSAGLRAMSEVVERLQVRARHVVFGHTHRAGVIAGDEPAEWLTPNGVQLHNTGSWVYSDTFLRGGDASSPYWPGCAVLIEDGAPPRALALLADRSPAGLSSRAPA
ncbi:MAG: metallophosphoesterase [Solirubrobacteraceae bacterium]